MSLKLRDVHITACCLVVDNVIDVRQRLDRTAQGWEESPALLDSTNIQTAKKTCISDEDRECIEESESIVLAHFDLQKVFETRDIFALHSRGDADIPALQYTQSLLQAMSAIEEGLSNCIEKLKENQKKLYKSYKPRRKGLRYRVSGLRYAKSADEDTMDGWEALPAGYAAWAQFKKENPRLADFWRGDSWLEPWSEW